VWIHKLAHMNQLVQRATIKEAKPMTSKYLSVRTRSFHRTWL
jgi:hypothetical protein